MEFVEVLPLSLDTCVWFDLAKAKLDDPIFKEGWSMNIGSQSGSKSPKPSKGTPDTTSKTGSAAPNSEQETLKESRLTSRELPADDPIYKRGFAVGMVRSTTSKSTAATTSKKKAPEKP